MSESHAFSALKAHAKQLLAAARAGDHVVIGKLREVLPKLGAQNDADFASEVLLADVQHAVARRYGVKSWAELKQKVEAADPIQIQAERFLHAVREHQEQRAAELLATHPTIARYCIHAAAAACDVNAMAEFIERDSSLVSKPDLAGKCEPMIYAAGTRLPALNEQMREANTACVQLLLDHGANATASISLGEGDHGSQLFALYFACAANNVGAAALLLQRGANPNDGECIPHAAEANHRECLELLLQYGANISDRHPDWDNTALYFLSGHKEFSPLYTSSELGMRWLLEHGANPNITSYVGPKSANLATRGEAPLHRLVAFGRSVECAHMFIEHGADANLPRGDGKMAYALAVRTGNTAVAEFLVGNGADTNALTPADELLGACAVADHAHARKILDMHPTLMSSLTAEDKQALALAVEEGKEDSVRLMVALGWSIADEGPWGGTPLHWAAWYGRVHMTKLLIELGAPINTRDSTYGSSPIAWAAHGSTNCRVDHDDDYIAVIDLLLHAGSTREASYNNWSEAPENLSSNAVANFLKHRGFATYT